MTQSRSKGEQKSRILRRLGPFERYQSTLHSMGIYAGTIVTCRYEIPEDFLGPDHQTKLKEYCELSIARTILEHPALQVGQIKEDSNKPAWVRLDSIDLSHHIKWQVSGDAEKHDSILREITRQQLDTRFSDIDTRPAWRITIFKLEDGRSIDVMFCWGHSHTDGTGAKIFHETLLRKFNTTDQCNQELTLKNHVLKTTVSAKNFTPPQEAVAKFPITLGYAARTMWQELKPPMFVKPRLTHANWAPICNTSLSTQVRNLWISNDVLQHVLVACRAHKTTLTGLLHGISLISFASQLTEEQAPAMISDTALNLRRHFNPGSRGYEWLDQNKTMANYVSVMDHEHDQALVARIRNLISASTENNMQNAALEEVMWSASIKVREEIQQRLNLGLKNDVVGLMKVVSDWRPHFADVLKKPRGITWLISNLGVIDRSPPAATSLEEGSKWSVQQASFTLCGLITGPVLNISPIAVKSGELCITITWQEDAVGAEVGERLMADIDGWLKNIGNSL